MIGHLQGTILESNFDKDALHVLVDVHGVGYEVLMPRSSEGFIREGKAVSLFVCESASAYDGVSTLYGFLSREEKDLFIRIRENVGGIGPKKALECIDKIAKSLPDFKRAVIDGDLRLLVSVFGFTKKTAEKLVFSLKEKATAWSVSGAAKWAGLTQSSEESDAISGLLNLGFRDEEARELVQKAKSRLGEKATTQSILQDALRASGSKVS